MKAIILAAGYATRLYPLTKNQPKPLLEIGPKTIADFLLDRLAQVKPVDHVFVVTNEKFFPYFIKWAEKTNELKQYPFEISIINDLTTSNETRLGAIADIQYVIDQEKIDDEMLITAGDNIFNFDFNNIFQFYKNHQTPVILVHPLKDKKRLTSVGVVEINDKSQIMGFEEKPSVPKSNLIAPPVYFIPQNKIHFVKAFIEKSSTHDAPGFFISWLHKQIPVYAYLMKEDYFDIGTLEMYNRVNELFASQDTA
jgi:glucose-1-phosphate thymidylyltransferase